MKKQLSAHGIKFAILGAALAATGLAYAADSSTGTRQHERAGHHAMHGHHGGHQAHPGFHGHHAGHHAGKGMHHHRMMQRPGLIVPGYGPVSQDFVDGMGLKAEQLKLVEEARKTARDLREQRKERVKQVRAARAELFKADTFNPEQALKQAEERRARLAAERRQLEEKWLAVWKSLDSDQQARVTTHLKDKAARAEKRAEKREERKKQREDARSERQRLQPTQAS